MALSLKLSEESLLLSEAQPVAQATGSRQPLRPGVHPASSGLAGLTSPEGLPREVSPGARWRVPDAAYVPDAGPAPFLLLAEPPLPVSARRVSTVASPSLWQPPRAARLSQPASVPGTGRRSVRTPPGAAVAPQLPLLLLSCPTLHPSRGGLQAPAWRLTFRSVLSLQPSAGTLPFAHQLQAAGLGVH